MTVGQQQLRGRIRRAALLDAALEVIAAGGIAALTHREVSRRAGMPPATTGYYFPTKDELVEQALLHHVRRRAARLARVVEEASAGATEPADLCRRVVVAMVQAQSDTLVLEQETYLEASRRPTLRQEVARSLEDMARVCEPVLARIGTFDPVMAGRCLASVIDGLALHRALHLLDAEADAVLIEGLVQVLSSSAPFPA